MIELKLKAAPKVDTTAGIHPNIPTKLLTEFATVENATKEEKRWMEKFGEWKHVTQINKWKKAGAATWEVDVAAAGAYYIDLRYRGEAEGRPVWKVSTDEGVKLQNEQASSPVYHTYPFGRLVFKKPGRHTISVGLFEGDPELSSLESIQLRPLR